MSEPKTFDIPKEVQAEIFSIPDEMFDDLTKHLAGLIEYCGYLLVDMGVVERDFPLSVHYVNTNFNQPEELMEFMVAHSDQTQKTSELMKAFLRLFMLLPKITNFIELDVQKKIDVGNRVIRLGKEIGKIPLIQEDTT